MIRTGEQYVERLRDGRSVLLDGERINDVTTHPAFRNAVATVARMYDFVADPANEADHTYVVPESADRANRIWQLPTTYQELVDRRRALEAWSELHAGFLGRSPDHVASCIAGMFMGIEVFESYDSSRAAALHDYYRYARDNDVYLSDSTPQEHVLKACERTMERLSTDRHYFARPARTLVCRVR